MAKKGTSDFGRDEMFALLGGDLKESLTRAPTKGTTKGGKIDLADMTVRETAALLLDENKKKAKRQAKTSRHRTSKQRQYHQLVAEEGAKLQDDEKSSSSSEEEEKEQPSVPRRRPRQDSSSSEDSNSNEDNKLIGRRRHDSDDDSSSDDDDDRRRRLLSRRQQVHQESGSESETEPEIPQMTTAMNETATTAIAPMNIQPGESIEKPASDESSSSESSSDDDSSEDSSSEEEEVITKPVFIPKHKRGIVKDTTETEKEEELVQLKKKEKEARRKKESRAMVQQAVTENIAEVDEDTTIDGILNAKNEMPCDNDDELDKDSWEIRELQRILADWDNEEKRVQEEREISRRRKMTDEERLAEDMKTGRFHKPGQQLDNSDQKFQQRYYHKGAFYMDEDEWEESDIRRKADAYAKAATGDDKIDKSTLPRVMQVKKFGKSGQGHYKGLAAEDTTDKGMKMLPLVKPSKKK